MISQEEYLAFDRFYGAYVGVAAEKMTDNLVSNAILLRCEKERGGLVLIKFVIRSSVEGGPYIANRQMYIPNSKGSGVRRHVGILYWSKEEE